jgi:hypothetical protein
LFRGSVPDTDRQVIGAVPEKNTVSGMSFGLFSAPVTVCRAASSRGRTRDGCVRKLSQTGKDRSPVLSLIAAGEPLALVSVSIPPRGENAPGGQRSAFQDQTVRRRDGPHWARSVGLTARAVTRRRRIRGRSALPWNKVLSLTARRGWMQAEMPRIFSRSGPRMRARLAPRRVPRAAEGSSLAGLPARARLQYLHLRSSMDG